MTNTIRVLSISLLVINGVAALFGGGSMLGDPTGTNLQLSIHWLDGTVFKDYFFPGLILFLVIGMLSLVTAVVTFFNHRWSSALIILQGCLLAGWIVIQAWLLQRFYFLQAIFGGMGFILFGLGVMLKMRRTGYS